MRLQSGRLGCWRRVNAFAVTATFCVSSLACLVSQAALGQTTYAVDSGIIKNLYSEPAGRIAIILDVPYSDAIAKNMCPGANGWAGIEPTADKAMKATMLMAKARGNRVRVIITGCYEGWYRVNSIYVDD